MCLPGLWVNLRYFAMVIQKAMSCEFGPVYGVKLQHFALVMGTF